MAKDWSFGPYLHVDDAAAAIDWYVSVFGATERERYPMDDGTIGHAELNIYGNKLYLADLKTGLPRPKHYKDVPMSLYAVVPDVDVVFNRAIREGATLERPLTNQEYGHRNGGFIDPFGHVWYVSSPL